MNLYQYFIRLGRRFCHLLELKYIRGPYFVQTIAFIVCIPFLFLEIPLE